MLGKQSVKLDRQQSVLGNLSEKLDGQQSVVGRQQSVLGSLEEFMSVMVGQTARCDERYTKNEDAEDVTKRLCALEAAVIQTRTSVLSAEAKVGNLEETLKGTLDPRPQVYHLQEEEEKEQEQEEQEQEEGQKKVGGTAGAESGTRRRSKNSRSRRQ